MSEHHKAHPDYPAMGIFAGYGECDDGWVAPGPQPGFDAVIVYDDGTHEFVPGGETILWYDWTGEWHYVRGGGGVQQEGVGRDGLHR